MSGFVTRIGSKLYVDGKPFKFGGINVYDLSFKNGDSSISNVSAFTVKDILTTAREMGATVIRVKDFGISQGHAGTFEPTQGVFDSTATGPTQVWDYALWQAGLMGIKLIPMMTDENTDLTGIGTVGVFCNWAGVALTYDNFYTNALCIQYYEEYLYNFLNHVNIYTGVAYKNDPAIFAVETGNELYGQNGSTNCANWVNTISTYFKSIDPNHLFLDGTWQAFPLNAALPNVDLLSDHFYPMDNVRLQNNIAVCTAVNKPLFVGEFNWAENNNPTTLQSFLATIEGNQNVICGDLPWNLDWRSLNGSWHNFIGSTGTLDIWYPSGTGDHGVPDKATRQQILRTHNYKMRGMSAPSHMMVAQPLITSITTSGGHNVVQWRGVTGAATYTLQCLQTSTNKWIAVANNLTDFLCPYTDTTQASGNVWYKIRAVNLDGVPGPYSPIASSGQRSTYSGQDDFSNRFVPATFVTWDYASDGQKWLTLTGTPVLSLTGTSGTIASSTGAQTIIMQLGLNTTGTDMEGYVRWSIGTIADTVSIYLRLKDSTHYYVLSYVGSTLTIAKKSGGSVTSLATTTVLIPTLGSHYWFHFKIVGTSLTGKMWPDKTLEPTSWMITATDSSVTSGGIGLGAIPTTTTPVTFDHYLTTVPQNAPQVAHVSVKVRS